MALFGALLDPLLNLGAAVTRGPAQLLTEFMDGVDEIWLVEAFMDQPEPNETGA